MISIPTYLREVRVELSKVVWPTKTETVRMTLIVFIISLSVAIYVGGLDFILTNLLTKVITR